MNKGYEQLDEEVEEERRIAENNRTKQSVTIAIIFSSLIFSILFYVPIFSLFDSQFRLSSSRVDQNVQGIDDMNFKPVNLTTITNAEDLLKNLIMTVEIKGKEYKKTIYLRARTYEIFTYKAMESAYGKEEWKAWPDFAFDKNVKKHAVAVKKASFNFYCNFEARFPYLPVLSNLSGPSKYRTMRDCSILLKHEISVGDIFTSKFIDLDEFNPEDELAEVDKSSPYLSLEGLNGNEIKELSLNIVLGDSINRNFKLSPNAIYLLAGYLAKNGVYKPDFELHQGCHPVEEFLFGNLKGHCQLFSASFVALCRACRIPARVATGFRTNFCEKNKYFVTSNMPHAWPEILTKKGWKIFDVSAINSKMPKFNKSSLDKSNSNLPKSIKKKFEFPSNQRLNEYMQKKKKYFRRANSPDFKRFFKLILNCFIIFVLIIIVYKFAEQFLVWLIEFMHKRKKQEIVNEIEKIKKTEEFEQLINRIEVDELTGQDLAEVFDRFAHIMGEYNDMPRVEPETASEYFERICLNLDVDRSDGATAASFLEAEVYGDHIISTKNFFKFCKILKSILSQKSVR